MGSAVENKNVRECRRSLSEASFAHFITTPSSEIRYDDLVHRVYSSAHEAIPPLSRVTSATFTGGPLPSQPYSHLTHPMYDQPSSGQYETFAPGGWARPIYEYMNNTVPVGMSGRVQIAPRHRSREYLTAARALAYHPAAKSIDYYQSDLDRSVDSYRRWNLGVVSTHPYYRDYYGNTGLRHFAGYRPRHAQHYIRAVWIS